MDRLHRSALNSASGLPIANPTITVFFAGTVAAAPIFSDEGVTAKANPFTGDAQGRYDFYAPDGDYDILVAGAGVTSYTIPDITVGDPKRATGFSESETWLVSNAFFNRQTSAWNRRDTAKPAWALVVDADVADDVAEVRQAPAAANPITWITVARFSRVASAVNFLALLNAIAAAGPELQALGTDANVDLLLRAKGTGLVRAVTGLAADADAHLRGDITPASLGASVNDYNPTGLATASTIRQASTLAVNITGLAGGLDGRLIILHNVGTFAITLTDEDAASAVANRFALNGVLALAADESCTLQYDSTSSRWRLASGQTGMPFQMWGAVPALNTAVGTEFAQASGFGAATDATEANRDGIVDGACEVQRFRVNLQTAPATTATRTFTVRKNGADTALTVTYASGELGEKVVAAAVAFAAGDKIAVASVVATAVAAASQGRWSLRLRETGA